MGKTIAQPTVELQVQQISQPLSAHDPEQTKLKTLAMFRQAPDKHVKSRASPACRPASHKPKPLSTLYRIVWKGILRRRHHFFAAAFAGGAVFTSSAAFRLIIYLASRHNWTLCRRAWPDTVRRIL